MELGLGREGERKGAMIKGGGGGRRRKRKEEKRDPYFTGTVFFGLFFWLHTRYVCRMKKYGQS